MNSSDVIELQSVTDNAEADFLFKRDVKPLISKRIKNVIFYLLLTAGSMAWSGLFSTRIDSNSLSQWASNHIVDILFMSFCIIRIVFLIFNLLRIKKILKADASLSEVTTTKLICNDNNFSVEIISATTIKVTLNYQDILKLEAVNNFLTLEVDVTTKKLGYESLVIPIYSNAFTKISRDDFVQQLKVRQEQSKNKLTEQMGIKKTPMTQNS